MSVKETKLLATGVVSFLCNVLNYFAGWKGSAHVYMIGKILASLPPYGKAVRQEDLTTLYSWFMGLVQTC